VFRTFCYISEYDPKKQCGELLADKVVRAFYFALLWLGNFRTPGCLIGRHVAACPHNHGQTQGLVN